MAELRVECALCGATWKRGLSSKWLLVGPSSTCKVCEQMYQLSSYPLSLSVLPPTAPPPPKRGVAAYALIYSAILAASLASGALGYFAVAWLAR